MSTPSSQSRSVGFAFALVTILFFLWGFCHAMLDVLNKHFQNILHVPVSQSTYIQFVTYMGYFLMAIPAGLLVRRFGYKGGILIGLGLVAMGAFLFIPAGNVFGTFWAFLTALFILFCGLACLETAANPYITILGPKETASSRLVLSQSFNAVGWILGPMVGGLLMFKVSHEEASGTPNFDTLLFPYIVLGSFVAVIFVIFSFLRLPEGDGEVDPHAIEPMDAGNSDPATVAAAEAKEGLGHYGAQNGEKSLFAKPHFTLGVLAQFFYVAAQTCIGAMMVNYLIEHSHTILNDTVLPILAGPLSSLYSKTPTIDQSASFMVSAGMLCFAIGRFSGSAILRIFSPSRVLATCAFASSLLLLVVVQGLPISGYFLVATFLFLSIMFPTIFALAIRDLGAQTKMASSALVMSIVGGAVIPLIMGKVIASAGGNIAIGYIVPLVCLLYVGVYGLIYPRLVAKS
jgi:FHS family L-fucose permease-like MFS transporter